MFGFFVQVPELNPILVSASAEVISRVEIPVPKLFSGVMSLLYQLSSTSPVYSSEQIPPAFPLSTVPAL